MEFKAEQIITAIMIKCSYTELSSKPTFPQSGSRSRVLCFFFLHVCLSVCVCVSILQVLMVQMSPIIKCCMAPMTRRSENKRPVNGFVHTLHYEPNESVSLDSHVLEPLHWSLHHAQVPAGTQPGLPGVSQCNNQATVGGFYYYYFFLTISKILISFPHIASMDSCSCWPFKRLVYFPGCNCISHDATVIRFPVMAISRFNTLVLGVHSELEPYRRHTISGW